MHPDKDMPRILGRLEHHGLGHWKGVCLGLEERPPEDLWQTPEERVGETDPLDSILDDLRTSGAPLQDPPPNRPPYTYGTNAAFECVKRWGQIVVDGYRGLWRIEHGWFEREDEVRIYPVYSGWTGRPSNPRPVHAGWWVQWHKDKLGTMKGCSAYVAMRAVDHRWKLGHTGASKLKLLMGDDGHEAPPIETVPPSTIVVKGKRKPLVDVLKDAARCLGKKEGKLILAAAARLEWLEKQKRKGDL